MYEFKVIKTSNEIEDICIAYGLCSILEYNDIPFSLKDNSNRFSIFSDEFDLGELVYNEINSEEVWNCGTSLNKGERDKNIPISNNFLEENLEDIFKYYLNGEINKKLLKKQSCIAIGNQFYGLGVRNSNKKKELKLPIINRHLALLGWIYGCSYFKNKKNEVTILLKPSQTKIIKKPFNFTYKDKDTQELKRLVSIKDETEVVLTARVFIETMLTYKMLYKEYDSIYFIQNILSSNKPIADKSYKLQILNLSDNLLEQFKRILTYSNIDLNVKDITAKYILGIKRYSNFSKLIKTYSKQGQKLSLEFKEELLKMYDDKVNSIFNNEAVVSLGKGLNRLLYNKEGFNIQVKLETVTNKVNLMKTIQLLIRTYLKKYESKILNDDSLQSLLELLNNNKDSKICADAILTYGTIFIKKKETSNNKDDNK